MMHHDNSTVEKALGVMPCGHSDTSNWQGLACKTDDEQYVKAEITNILSQKKAYRGHFVKHISM